VPRSNRRFSFMLLWVLASAAGTAAAEAFATTASGGGVLPAGAIVAVPQWLVLRYFVGTVDLWVPTSAVAFPTGLATALLGGTLLAAILPSLPIALPGWLEHLASPATVIGLIAVVGGVLGAGQCVVLQPWTSSAWRWIAASAVGAAGYVLVRGEVGLLTAVTWSPLARDTISGAAGGVVYGLLRGITVVLFPWRRRLRGGGYTGWTVRARDRHDAEHAPVSWVSRSSWHCWHIVDEDALARSARSRSWDR